MIKIKEIHIRILEILKYEIKYKWEVRLVNLK